MGIFSFIFDISNRLLNFVIEKIEDNQQSTLNEFLQLDNKQIKKNTLPQKQTEIETTSIDIDAVTSFFQNPIRWITELIYDINQNPFQTFGYFFNAFSIQNYASIFIFTMLSFVVYLFPSIQRIGNFAFFNIYEEQQFTKKEQYIMFKDLLVKNPNISKKENYLIKFLLYDIIQLNYRVEVFIDKKLYEKSKQILDNANINYQYCIYLLYGDDDLYFNNQQEQLGIVNNRNSLNIFKFNNSSNTGDSLIISISGTNNINEFLTDILLDLNNIPSELEKLIGCSCFGVNSGIQRFSTLLTDIIDPNIKNFDPIQLIPNKRYIPTELIYEIIKKNMGPNTKVYLYGHSLGGAIMVNVYLYILYYIKRFQDKLDVNNIFLYTYGSPKISNASLGLYIKRMFPNLDLEKNVFMIINNNDIVTQIPLQNPNKALTYIFPFPERQEYVYTSDTKNSYFNFYKGTLSHIDYYNALEREYLNNE